MATVRLKGLDTAKGHVARSRRFVVTDVQPGTYMMEVRLRGTKWLSLDVQEVVVGDIDLDLHVLLGRRLRGTISRKAQAAGMSVSEFLAGYGLKLAGGDR